MKYLQICRIKHVPDKYPDIIPGMLCTIRSSYMSSYRVEIPGFANTKSKLNLFYLFERELIEINENYTFDEIYSINKDIASKIKLNSLYGKGAFMENRLISGYRVAAVAFARFGNDSDIIPDIKEGKTWAYAVYDNDLKVGDYVLCATGHHGAVIGKIKEFYDKDEMAIVEHGREIICKIDYSSYFERKQRLAKLTDLKYKMSKKLEQLNELAMFEAMAKCNPELAEMLKEFKELM